MSKRTAGLTAGILAGAAGATALNAAAYADQAIRGTAPTSSPAGGAPARTADAVIGSGGPDGGKTGARRAALGPLGGLGIGVAVAAVAGALRSESSTPPRPLAAAVLGVVAMAAGDGIAVATKAAPSDWAKPVNLLRDLVPHLAYGAVTVWALHKMLDPRTTVVAR